MLRPIVPLLASTMIFASLFLANSETAMADPALCYWQSSTGQTIDLSSICGRAANQTQTSKSLQSLLKTYPPDIQQDVTQYVQQHRDSIIAQAKTTCRILRYGGQQAAATRRQALTNYRGGNAAIQARQATIDAYAIANYCPEFAQ